MDDTIVNKRRIQHPEVSDENKTGWDIFSPDVAWFLYDFFKYELNGYEKLIFYSYYINGMTLQEIANSADCTFQNIGVIVNKIEKRLRIAWKNKAKWRKKIDDSKSADRCNS